MNEPQTLSILITNSLSVVCRIMAAKTLKKIVSLIDSEVESFLEEKENQYTKRKTESYEFSGFGVAISLGWEWLKINSGKICHFGRFRQFTRKTSSVGKEKVNKWEVCKYKITTIVVFDIIIQRIFPS